MKIADLKELIAKVPDHVEVFVSAPFEDETGVVDHESVLLDVRRYDGGSTLTLEA